MHYNCFKEFFEKNLNFKNIKHNLTIMCIELTNQYFPDWFLETHECYKHRLKILDMFLLILLRKNCKWLSQEISDKSGSDRLKVLNK